jgi:hypothetical protein
LDTEWLLSTLFDASLLSTSKAAGNGGSFFGVFIGVLQSPQNCPESTLSGAWLSESPHRAETIKTLAAGLRRKSAQ